MAEMIPMALQWEVSPRNTPPGDSATTSRNRAPPRAWSDRVGSWASSARASAALCTSPETSPALKRTDCEEVAMARADLRPVRLLIDKRKFDFQGECCERLESWPRSFASI